MSAMGKWSRRWSPKYWPKWYRLALVCCGAGAVCGGMLAWFGPGWGRYVALAGVILCFICLSICFRLLTRLLEEGPDRVFGDD
ncbi:MAG: hypothetical protein OXJ54_09760 [Gemmatimonadetes bacterium]|nr:hypothetical protein [Candidatus Palauibacter rhopaloidicola]